MPPADKITLPLKDHPLQQSIESILRAVLQAADPARAVRNFVRVENRHLFVDGSTYALDDFEEISLLGIGKAAEQMTLPLAEMLSGWPTRGLLIPKQAAHSLPAGFRQITGGHPLPNQNSLLAGQQAMQFAQPLTEKHLFIALLSGGGSALATRPTTGISLADLQELTSQLLACGARIEEINTLRRALDDIKGGGLARAASPATMVSLILSDVVSGNPADVSSGPTVPGPTGPADAYNILEKYNLLQTTPESILRVLTKPLETAVQISGEPANQVVVVGSNHLAAQAALRAAESSGFHTTDLGNHWQGEAQQVAKQLVERLKKETQRPACLVAGGETTVTLHGEGRGGRNTELALAAALALDGLENALLVSLATDGEDGPTDAAGAVASGETLARARELGLDASGYLARNDSYSFFNQLTGLIKIGPTGTNVNDLVFMFRW